MGSGSGCSPRLSFGIWTFLEEQLNNHPVSNDSLVVLAAGGHQGSCVREISCRTHPDSSDHVQEATASSDPGCQHQAPTYGVGFLNTTIPPLRKMGCHCLSPGTFHLSFYQMCYFLSWGKFPHPSWCGYTIKVTICFQMTPVLIRMQLHLDKSQGKQLTEMFEMNMWIS